MMRKSRFHGCELPASLGRGTPAGRLRRWSRSDSKVRGAEVSSSAAGWVGDEEAVRASGFLLRRGESPR